MIGYGSMIVFVLCSIGYVLLLALLFINKALRLHRERMLDEEFSSAPEDDEMCSNCGLKLEDCDCEYEQTF